jgi:hypothetical protein
MPPYFQCKFFLWTPQESALNNFPMEIYSGDIIVETSLTPELLFSHVGTAAMVGWALLILGPRRFTWLNAVPLWIIPAGLSAVYAALVFSRFSGMGGGFDSLASVATLLSDDWALLAAWVHFLAFDLFVGAVIAARMDRAGVDRLVQAPILASTFMLGPLGFLIAALTELGLRAGQLPTQIRSLKGTSHVFA